jgi:acyl dehydratase
MRIFKRLADVAAAAGRELGPSSWVTRSQERIDKFAAATGDHQWIHVDPARTQAELDMPPIAHGYLSLSMIPSAMYEIFTVESAARILNYGANKVRFTNMVPAGSRIRTRLVLKEAELSATSIRTILEATVEIEGVQKPALIAEAIMLFYE